MTNAWQKLDFCNERKEKPNLFCEKKIRYHVPGRFGFELLFCNNHSHFNLFFFFLRKSFEIACVICFHAEKHLCQRIFCDTKIDINRWGSWKSLKSLCNAFNRINLSGIASLEMELISKLYQYEHIKGFSFSSIKLQIKHTEKIFTQLLWVCLVLVLNEYL